MTKLVAVSSESHARKVWQPPASYQFAAKEAVAPIVLAEAAHVGSWMPIVFVQQAGRYVPMAMMSPMPGQNLFIAPNGQWLGAYVPSALRSYPFRLVRPAEGSDRLALCIDEDSGLVRDAGEKGENFFTDDGKPSQSVSKLMEYLGQIEANRVATDLAMASLAETGVLEPWPLQVEADGKKSAVQDVYRANESKIGQLADDVFLKLRKTGGLPLAYAQMISMAQTVRFEQLMKLRQQLAQTPKIKPEEIFKGEPSDLIRFE